MLAIPFLAGLEFVGSRSNRDELIPADRSFSKPMPAPPVASISIGCFLEPLTPQRMQHLILDLFNCRGEVRDQMLGMGIQEQHHGVGQKRCHLLICGPCLEQPLVLSRQKILFETAYRTSSSQNRPANSLRIESHQRSIAFLDFDNPVLDRHLVIMGRELL